MTDPIYDTLAVALQDIRGRLGDAAFADQRRLSSLLLDVAPEARREIRVIATAIGEGVPAALQGAERSLLGMEIDRQASRLESATGLQRDLALQTVRVLSYALGLGPLPSVYGSGAAPAPAAAQDSWAGLSEVVSGPMAQADVQPAPVYNPPPQPKAKGNFLDNLPFPKKYLYIGLGVLVAIVAGIQMLNMGPRQPNGPDPGPITPGGGPNPPLAPGEIQPGPVVGPVAPENQAPPVDNAPVAPAEANAPPVNAPPVNNPPPAAPVAKTEPAPAPAAVRPSNFAEELADFGVPAKRALEQNVGTPTPLSIPVGKRITTAELQALLQQDRSVLLVDVLDGPHPQTLRGAIYFPELGYPGSTNDGLQPQVANHLRQVAGNNTQRPIVFFCQGARCWESYNAVLRASAAGYRNLYWYRGGLMSWQAAGGPMQGLR